jgi:imidazolonepropionase-like amidohydrolase
VLVIQGDRITGVGESAPAGAKVIDLTGKTIIPGLISAHSHVGQVKGATTGTEECFTRENVAAQLAQYERYGVTAILSLGMNKDELYAWREEQRAGKLPGADIFTADRGIGVPSSAPPVAEPNPVYRPKNPEEARAAVRETAARHPDLLKMWVDDFFGSVPKMSPAVYRAIITEAHAQNLRVASHLFYLADAKALVTDGLDVIAHSVRDQLVDEEFLAAMRAHKTLYIPTLALDESQYIYAEHPAWMDTPFFQRAVAPELLRKWLSPEYSAKMRVDPKTPRNKAAAAIGQLNAKLIFDAGITIAMGTDSGALPTRVAGFGEHRELQLLVQAGLSPMDALVCATRNSAQVLGQERERGTLQPGKRADFIILNANPLEDIRNTEEIEAVWHGGKKCGKP